MNFQNYARELVSGIQTWEELCRQAAHNLADRKEVEKCIQEESGSMSKVRRAYLSKTLQALHFERKCLIEKKREIQRRVNRECLHVGGSNYFKFII